MRAEPKRLGDIADFLLVFVAVPDDVDEEIATEKVAANEERIFHVGAVVQRNQHFFLDALPLKCQSHFVAVVEFTFGKRR